MMQRIADRVETVSEDVREIKNGQQRVVYWVAGMVASLVVGGILGWVFQK
mgnify:CR=1 FL=1